MHHPTEAVLRYNISKPWEHLFITQMPTFEVNNNANIIEKASNEFYSFKLHFHNSTLKKDILDGKCGKNLFELNFYLRNCGFKKHECGYILSQFNIGDTISPKNQEQIADEVINGQWGNGLQRIRDLGIAGYAPLAIQEIVNSRLKFCNNNHFNKD